jgi:hypothetical protein
VDTPRLDRAALRRALLVSEPWLGDPDRGPQAVDAGPCDRCRDHPRLLPTCGPDGWPGLCRPCALGLGVDAWCDGHLDDAVAELAWARQLPDHWDVAVTLWWIATGEVRPGSVVDLRDTRGLAAPVRAELLSL